MNIYSRQEYFIHTFRVLGRNLKWIIRNYFSKPVGLWASDNAILNPFDPLRPLLSLRSLLLCAPLHFVSFMTLYTFSLMFYLMMVHSV